jgi:hypothetical protein
MKSMDSNGGLHAMFCGVVLAAAVMATGCQVSTSGQTLPSAYYMRDDVQYFAPGPEFKLAREAAMLKAHNADQQMQGR